MATHAVKVVVKARDEASRKFKHIGGSALNMGSMIKKAAVAAGVYLGVRELLRFGRTAVDVAASVAEMKSKFDAVFKAEAATATNYAENLASATQRSKEELMGFMASLQDTFVPLGFARAEARKMSGEMTKLAVDMASFNDKTDGEVVRDLQSAIVGNHETVRKYGVIITQSTLGQELMNMGIAKGIKAATEMQKAQARLSIIMKGTTDAQGDAVRTAGEYTNTLKGLKAIWRELKVAVGNWFLPALTMLNKLWTESIRNIRDWAVANQGQIEIWAYKAVSSVELVKDVFLSFLGFMKKDWRDGIRFVFDSFLLLLKATFKSAVTLSIAGGRGIWKGIKEGLMGPESARAIEQRIAKLYKERQWGPGEIKEGLGYGVHRTKIYYELYKEAEKQVLAEKTEKLLGGTLDVAKAHWKKAFEEVMDSMPPDLAKGVNEAFKKHYARLSELAPPVEKVGGVSKRTTAVIDEVKKVMTDIKRSLRPLEARFLTFAPGATQENYDYQTAKNTASLPRLLREQIKHQKAIIQQLRRAQRTDQSASVTFEETRFT